MLSEEEPRKIGFFRSGSSGYDCPGEGDVDVLVLRFMEESGACHYKVWSRRGFKKRKPR